MKSNLFESKNNKESSVRIINYTPEPERICAAAAKISTTKGSALDIFEETTCGEKSHKLIKQVIECGHKSIVEHIYFNIAFDNVSVIVEQFLIEFRLASFTVKSRRYVDFRSMGYYTPKWRLKSNDINKNDIANDYRNHSEYLFRQYEMFVNEGIPKEDARFVLPYSFNSNLYCTVNGRELAHIIYSALYGRGKDFSEIRLLGESLLKQAYNICPSAFSQENIMEEYSQNKVNVLISKLSNNKISRQKSQNLCELLYYTEDSDNVVVQQAIVNSTLCSIEEAKQVICDDEDFVKECLELIFSDKRKRELELINFTFRINNISLAGLTHLVRHRIQSICIPQLTQIGDIDRYVIPDSIKQNPYLLDKYIETWNIHKVKRRYYKSLGILDEDLVYMLLSGDFIDIVTTMNGRELIHFIQLRTCNRAQWEIRNITIEMLKTLRNVSKNIFSKVGPACFTEGICPEGKLTCGKMSDIREYFGKANM